MVVMVLGMHRSGTSAVAGLLHALGVNMGRHFLEPNVGNPRGYWEDLDMLSLNVALLRVAGGNWLEPPLGRDIAIAHQHMAGQMGRLMLAKVRHAAGAPWGWKDPRNCLTLHAWHNTMARLDLDPLFVEVVRDPGQVVWSLIKRARIGGSWWTQHKSTLAWAQLIREYEARVEWYEATMAQAAPGWLDGRWVTVPYERLLESPSWWAKHLAEAVGLEPSMLELTSAAATIKKPEASGGVEASAT